jgi:aldehyde dehydrogenase (NAD+)
VDTTSDRISSSRTLFVDGAWRQSANAETFERRNPADPDDLAGRFAEAGEADVAGAVASAVEGQRAWAATGVLERGAVLRRMAHTLRENASTVAVQLVREEGKPRAEALGEVLRAADVFDYFGAAAARPSGVVLPSHREGVTAVTERRPVGVVAVITPFNFPAFVSAMKLAPALLAGNSVIWKVAPAAPGTGMYIVDLLVEAGLVPQAVNYLTGARASLGEALVAHDSVDAITFTGSTEVGLAIGRSAARRHARVQQEMGGKNPMVVMRDCDLDRAVRHAVDSVFGGTGQRCTSAGKLLVDSAVAPQFLEGLVAAARALRVGNGMDPETQVGPLVDARASERVRGAVADAVAGGARVLYEPDDPRHQNLPGECFVGPYVVGDVRPGMRLFDEETFGPVAAVTTFDTLDEAIALSRHPSYGLTAAIHTNDLGVADRFMREVSVGVVNVNLPTSGVEPHIPFGGVSLSGSPHRELGPEALNFFTTEQTRLICA